MKVVAWPTSWGSVHSYLERKPFYATKNDRGQDHEAPELLVDIRGWMSHNTLKLLFFTD